MKKPIAVLALFAVTVLSTQAQGLVVFLAGVNAATRISTNAVPGGPSTGLTFGAGQYCFALYYSSNATSVSGQTAAILGNANNNYAFNDGAWKVAAYGTNLFPAGRLASVTHDANGYVVVPGISGGSNAQFVVIGWSANIGTNIAAVQAWYNSGFPFSNGLIGQSVVSGPILLGDGGVIAPPSMFGTGTGQIPGFVLGKVTGGLFSPPDITSQPTNQTVSAGGTASFATVAYGDASLPFSYQWKLGGTNISGGGNYAMTVNDFNFNGDHHATFTLNITNAQLTNAGNYSVFISNSAGSVTSSNAQLTVTGGAGIPPTILTQPANVTVSPGTNVTFTIGVAGTAPLTYQWNFNSTNIPNATNPSLTLMNVQPTNAGNYSVSITNAYGSTNSAVAVLTVQAVPTFPPFITAQPANLFVPAGNNAKFSVGVTGTAPFSYQWTFNSTNLPNGTNASYTVLGAQTNNAGSYGVTITNLYGVTNSASATLSVTPSQNIGYVIFGNPSSSITKISTNSTVGGAATGLTAGSGKYYFALFASAAATSVNGRTNVILGNAGTNYAFNDGAWTLVAYGTNTFLAGRFFSSTANASFLTPVLGFAGGTTAQFVVIGWSANIGQDIATVQTWFKGGSPASDGWIGQSMVSGSIFLSDDGLIPPSLIFGKYAPLMQGFTLGLTAGTVNGHSSYSLPIVPPLILQATMNGNNLILSWPLSAGSYGVQLASSPAGPWNDSGLEVGNDGTTASATVPVVGQQQYFRLMAQ